MRSVNGLVRRELQDEILKTEYVPDNTANSASMKYLWGLRLGLQPNTLVEADARHNPFLS